MSVLTPDELKALGLPYKQPLRVRARNAKNDALRWFWRTPFGWLMWNPVVKYHRVGMHPAPMKNPMPFLNGEPAPHRACAMFSVFGWGWFDGYLTESCDTSTDGRRLVRGKKTAAVRTWMFGRVELRPKAE